MRQRLLAGLCGALLLVAAGPAAAHAALPVVYDFNVGFALGLADPTGSPPGSNDFTCRPTAAHPNPVVLVHGTFENRRGNWNALSPLLKNNGYCVFAINYGSEPASPLMATRDIPASARQLSGFVDRVLAATGASEVDIVGHSQGGMMPRYYLRNLGGAGKIRVLVGLSPSNHGTTLGGIATLASAFPGGTALLGALCRACDQQLKGSSFLRDLNSGGDTVAGVSYTVIQTRYDEVVTPYASAFLSGPAVTNVRLQDQCVLDGAEHLAIAYDHIALREVLNALDPSTARRAACYPVLPVRGG